MTYADGKTRGKRSQAAEKNMATFVRSLHQVEKQSKQPKMTIPEKPMRWCGLRQLSRAGGMTEEGDLDDRLGGYGISGNLGARYPPYSPPQQCCIVKAKLEWLS